MSNYSRTNTILNLSRLIAIISIISAHIVVTNSSVQSLYSNFGLIGVPTFLFLSGYFYRINDTTSFITYLYERFLRIMIPAFFSGLIVYFYILYVTGNALILKNLFSFIIGIKTYLYYCTVLFIINALHYFVKKTRTKIILILISILSIFLTEIGFLTFIIDIGLTNYLNVVNWLGFYFLGSIANKYLGSIYVFRWIIHSAFIILFLIVYLLLCILDIKLSYFSIYGFLFGVLGTIFCISIASFAIGAQKLVEKISKYIFPIYLYHLPIIAVVTNIIGFPSIVITFIFTYGIIYIGDKFSDLLHLNKLYRLIMGIREHKIFIVKKESI